MRVTVVDPTDGAGWLRLRADVPALDEVAEVTREAARPGAVKREEWEHLQAARGLFDAVYIALDDPDEAHVVAAAAAGGLGGGPRPGVVVICGGPRGPAPEDEVAIAPRIEDGAAELLGERLDRVARRIHDEYLRDRRTPGRAPWGSKPADRPWEQLPSWLRDRSRDQADHIPVKRRILQALGVAPEALRDGEDDLVELLAEVEHRRWMASTAMAGFVHGERRDETTARTHPDMEPYEALSEPIKDYDRAAVRRLPDLLALGEAGPAPGR